MQIPATSLPLALLGGPSEEVPSLRGARDFQAFVDAEFQAPPDQLLTELVDIDVEVEEVSGAQHETAEAVDSEEKSQEKQDTIGESAPSERAESRTDADISSDAPNAELVFRQGVPEQKNSVIHSKEKLTDSTSLSVASSMDPEVRSQPSEPTGETVARPQIRHPAEAALLPGDSFQIAQPGPKLQQQVPAETAPEAILTQPTPPKSATVLQELAAPLEPKAQDLFRFEPAKDTPLQTRLGVTQSAPATTVHLPAAPSTSPITDEGQFQVSASPAVVLNQWKNAPQDPKMSAIADFHPHPYAGGLEATGMPTPQLENGSASVTHRTPILPNANQTPKLEIPLSQPLDASILVHPGMTGSEAHFTKTEVHSPRITQDTTLTPKEAIGIANRPTSWPQNIAQTDRQGWPQNYQPLSAAQIPPPTQSNEPYLMQSERNSVVTSVDPLSTRPITEPSTNAHAVSGPTWIGTPESRAFAVQSEAQLPRPQHIAAQLSTAIPQAQGDVFDLQLSPQELGKVRLSLTANEQSSVLHVITDRPETLDLLRRHIGVLENDLRSLGHDNLTLRFGTGAGTEGGNQQFLHRQTEQPDGSRTPRSSTSETPENLTPKQHAPLARQQHATDTLDVRL